MNAKDKEKKENELLWLNLFRERFPNFPQGELIWDGQETPDFIVKGTAESIGIEVTRIFREPEPVRQGAAERMRPLQQHESETEQIVAQAKSAYIKTGLPSVDVVAQFSGRVRFGRQDVAPLASSLFEIVMRNIPEVGGQRHVEFTGDNQDYFSDRIARVTVSRFADESWSGHWRPAYSAWNPKSAPKHLQDTLDAKEAKYQPCRKKCDSVWLLVAANSSTGLGSHVEFSGDLKAHCFESSFDRVFLLHQFFTRITELSLKR